MIYSNDKGYTKKDVCYAVLFLLCLFTAIGSIIFGVCDKIPRKGMASYYAEKYHGRQTASGEIFDTHALTAAHKTLPFGTIVEVTNLENGKSVRVRINDRGPFVKGRIIDLSYMAAQRIGIVKAGVGKVSMKIIERVE